LWLGVFFTIIFSSSSEFLIGFLGPLFGPILELIRGGFELIIHPILFLKTIIHLAFGIIFEIFNPIVFVLKTFFLLFVWLVKLQINFFWFLIYIPQISLTSIFYLLKYIFLNIYYFIKSILIFFTSIKKFLFPVIEAKATIESS